jgi:hypothetical protein
MSDYRAFLESKFKFSKSWGFDVADSEINPLMKPHQRDVIRWAATSRAATRKRPRPAPNWAPTTTWPAPAASCAPSSGRWPPTCWPR